MIVDWIENMPKYYDRLPGLQKGMECVTGYADWSAGDRREFDGGYVMRQEGETKPLDEGTFEAHIRYIDVQILQEGRDWYTLWNRVGSLEEEIPYNVEKDCTRYRGEGPLLELRTGMFAVFYPDDAHKADRRLNGEGAEPYKKFLIKLEVDGSMNA